MLDHRFAVTPLTDDCGLVEWVNDLTTLRHTVQAMLSAEGIYHKTTNIAIKKLYDSYPQVTPYRSKRRDSNLW